MGLLRSYDPVLARNRLDGTVLGAGATQVYVWRSVDNFVTSSVLRGGFGAPMSGAAFSIDDYEFAPGVPTWYQMTSYNGSLVQQASFTAGPFTQDLDGVWLKSLSRPFLNQLVSVQDVGDVRQEARGEVFRIVGRSAGIAVSDVRGGREYEMTVNTEDVAAAERLRFLVAGGDPLFVHVPLAEQDKVTPGYFAVGDVDRALAMRRSPRRYWTLPLVEVAAPGPDVFGSQITYLGVSTRYATYNALLAANATYNDLLNLFSSPSEVIVP